MTARVLATADGRRVPALRLAGGLYATRGDRGAYCLWGAGGGWGPWRLLTGGGVWVYGARVAFDAPLADLRAAAAELALLPVPWEHGGEAELKAALAGDTRYAARKILSRRLICPGYES